MNASGEDAEMWRARAGELQRLLEQERRDSQHRVRNILSVIRSIARRTDAAAAGDYHALLDGRLASFCRAQVALLRNPAKGVELGAIVGDELLAVGMGLDHAHLPETPLFLSAGAVGVVSLIVHELVGLIADADDMTVGWVQADDGAGFTIDWRSRIGRDSDAADMTFLREMVGDAVGYELAGRGDLQIDGEWLTCRIALPQTCLAERP